MIANLFTDQDEMPRSNRDRMPTTVTLLTPANSTYNAAPSFTWTAAAPITHYEFELATDAAFTSIVESAEVAGTAYSPEASLTASLYYWRVRGVNNFRHGLWSSVWSFAPVYLLNDTFTTPMSAPLAGSRSAEPGPGLMKKSADTNNRGSLIVGGKFRLSGVSANSFVDPTYFWTNNDDNGYSRRTGRVYLFKNLDMRVNTSRPLQIGLSTTGAGAASLPIGVYFESGTALRARIGNAALQRGTWATGTYHIAIVDLNPGFGVYIKGGSFTTWELLGETDVGTQTPLSPLMSGVSTTEADLADMLIRDTAGLNAAHILDEIAPATETPFTAKASGIFEMAFTTIASPVVGNKVGFRYREQDAQNYWTVYYERESNGWHFKHDKVIAGVTTNFRDALAATPAFIGVDARANIHRPYERSGAGVYGAQGTGTTDSDLNTVTGVTPFYSSNAAPVHLIVRDLTNSSYDAVLDAL